MTVSASSSGTQTAVINTEHTLANIASAGVYTVHVSRLNMLAGDTLQLRIYQTILTGDTAYVAYYQQFEGAPSTDEIIAISVPIANDLTDASALKFTLKQTSGTARDFKWKILKY